MLKFIEIINRIKQINNVEKDKEVAELLETTAVYLSQWKKRNTIPIENLLTYCKNHNANLEYILTGEKENCKKLSNGNNSIQVNGNMHGSSINLNSNNEMSHEICKEIKKLPTKKIEYFYHLIKAETLKEE